MFRVIVWCQIKCHRITSIYEVRTLAYRVRCVYVFYCLADVVKIKKNKNGFGSMSERLLTFEPVLKIKADDLNEFLEFTKN